ncbi:MAG: non-heme iron oxygenase ferredoxin subunit [Gammaproteobacteria bacterium]|nr:non-heme iron oxygenase ferredoxin subunit [Gammaproteobacteria bacterium]
MSNWIRVCALDEIDIEDVKGFIHDGRNFAVYRIDDGLYATDGLCTHEVQDLAEGFVMDNIIECPLHGGQFDIRTGRALCPPVCVDLATYPVKVEDGIVYIGL